MRPELRQRLRTAPRLLFVCSGNMIRSAFAELYACHRGCPRPVRSAATTYRNRTIHAEAARALLARGVPRDAALAFRPAMLDERAPWLGPGAVAFGMTRDHLVAMRALLAPSVHVHLLAELRGEPLEISDPLFDGRYDQAFERIAACVDALLDELGDELVL